MVPVRTLLSALPALSAPGGSRWLLLVPVPLRSVRSRAQPAAVNPKATAIAGLFTLIGCSGTGKKVAAGPDQAKIHLGSVIFAKPGSWHRRADMSAPAPANSEVDGGSISTDAPGRQDSSKAARCSTSAPESAPPHSISLLELPTEMLLAVLEWLVKLDPITLLGSVPGLCRRMRAVCAGVRGEFNLRGQWGRLDGRNSRGAKGALAAASLHFPRTRGLWTFSEFALYNACQAGLVVAAGRLLEEDGGRVKEEGRWGDTPLFVACSRGHLEVVRLLVEKGADMDKAAGFCGTPLIMACQEGHLEIVRLLVEKGADMDKARDDGATPLGIARDKGHAEVVAFLEQAGARA